jgi:hypothetical protein
LTGLDACSPGPVVVAYIGRIDRAGSGALERTCLAVE